MKAFSDDWKEAIGNLPPSPSTGQPSLHTADFINGEKQYREHWKGRYEEKNKILAQAAQVISAHSYRVMSCVLPMKDYGRMNEVLQLSELLGTPYALLARFSWEMVRAWNERVIFTDPIAMLFEQRHGVGDVHELFLNDKQPIPQTGDKSIFPLQAADYITWMRQQRLKPSNAYNALRGSWAKISKIMYDDYTIRRQDLEAMCREVGKLGQGELPTREEHPVLQVRFERNPKRPRPYFKVNL